MGLNHKHQTPFDGFKGLKQNWKNDIVAAVSVALVSLPLGLGIAAAGGVNPMWGVMSVIIGGLITTFIRGSHVAINGPGNGLIVIVFASVTALDIGDGKQLDYLLAAFIVSGVVTILFGLLRLGKLGEVFPSTVVYGMMAAIGIIIVGSQFHAATGNVTTTESKIGYLLDIPASAMNINPIIFGITALGLVIMFMHSKIHLKLIHFIPGPVWVLGLGVLAVFIFDILHDHDIVIFNTKFHLGKDYLVSVPDSFLDTLPTPNFTRLTDPAFWGVVLSITFVTSLETIVSAKATEKLDPFHRAFNLNRELIGTGIGTVISGFLGGLPVMTVVARSSVNVTHGAKTRWSNFFQGLILLIISLFALKYMNYIPKAALSAILIFTGYHLVSPVVWGNINKKGKDQLLMFVVTIVATLLLGLIYGVLLGMVFTWIVHIIKSGMGPGAFLKMQFKPEIRMVEEDNKLFIRAKGILNFLTLPKIKKLLASLSVDRPVSVGFSSAPLIDLTVMEYLRSFRKDHTSDGGELEYLGLEGLAASSSHPASLRFKSKNLEKHHKVKRLTGRQRQIEKLCEKNGWGFNPEINWELEQLPQFLFFELRPIEYSQNIIYGNYAELDISWEVSDVIFSEGAILATEEYEVTCQLINLPKPLPQFTVEQHSFIDTIVQSFGYESIDYKTHAELSDHYTIKVHEDEDIEHIFTPELMKFLETHEVYHIECSGDAVIIFNHIRHASPGEIDELVDFGAELVEYLQQENK